MSSKMTDIFFLLAIYWRKESIHAIDERCTTFFEFAAAKIELTEHLVFQQKVQLQQFPLSDIGKNVREFVPEKDVSKVQVFLSVLQNRLKVRPYLVFFS